MNRISILHRLIYVINKKSHVNTRLGTDNDPPLIMPPISKDCANTFLES